VLDECGEQGGADPLPASLAALLAQAHAQPGSSRSASVRASAPPRRAPVSAWKRSRNVPSTGSFPPVRVTSSISRNSLSVSARRWLGGRTGSWTAAAGLSVRHLSSTAQRKKARREATQFSGASCALAVAPLDGVAPR
jgi:hypothetical protein